MPMVRFRTLSGFSPMRSWNLRRLAVVVLEVHVDRDAPQDAAVARHPVDRRVGVERALPVEGVELVPDRLRRRPWDPSASMSGNGQPMMTGGRLPVVLSTTVPFSSMSNLPGSSPRPRPGAGRTTCPSCPRSCGSGSRSRRACRARGSRRADGPWRSASCPSRASCRRAPREWRPVNRPRPRRHAQRRQSRTPPRRAEKDNRQAIEAHFESSFCLRGSGGIRSVDSRTAAPMPRRAISPAAREGRLFHRLPTRETGLVCRVSPTRIGQSRRRSSVSGREDACIALRPVAAHHRRG